MNENNNGGEVDLSKLSSEELEAVENAEKFILDFKEEDYNDPDKVEQLKEAHEKAKISIHQKRHFREKSTKLEGEVETLKKGGTPGKTTTGNENAGGTKKDDTTPKSVSEVQIVSFRQDNPTLSKEVVNEIARLAGALGATMEEVAASPTGKAVIGSMTNKENNAAATVESSRQTGAGLEKKDWSNASPAEMEQKRREIMGIK